MNRKTKRPGKWVLLGAALLLVIAAIVAAVVLLLPAREPSQPDDSVYAPTDNSALPTANPQEPVETPITINPTAQNMYDAKTPEEVEREPITGFTDIDFTPLGTLEHDLTVTRAGSYSGTFVEDGSDREVSNVLALVLTNNSDRFLEYVQIALTAGEETAVFDLTSLPAGQSVLVMEKTAMTYDGQTEYGAPVVMAYTAPDKDFSLYPETFSIIAADGVVNLRNNSEESYSGHIAIYYKNAENGIYIGGITYSRTLENGIAAGGIAQFVADHYTVAGSELVFIAYEP